MKRARLFTIGLALSLLVINIPPIHWILGSSNCRYSNAYGGFTFEQINSTDRNFEMCNRRFNEFKKQNTIDTILYRTCTKSWWKVWNYSDYWFQPQWELPYMPWPEIEKRRGPVDNKTGFQDF